MTGSFSFDAGASERSAWRAKTTPSDCKSTASAADIAGELPRTASALARRVGSGTSPASACCDSASASATSASPSSPAHCDRRARRPDGWVPAERKMGLTALAAGRPRGEQSPRPHDRALNTIQTMISLRDERSPADRAHAHGRVRARARARGGAIAARAADRSGHPGNRRRRHRRERARARIAGPPSRRQRRCAREAPRVLAELRRHAERCVANLDDPGADREAPRPGCGSRSAASSGCSRCGS